jgi:signal transduction histidine kinase
MEQIRGVIGELEAVEERQLGAYTALQERDRQFDLWILFVGASVVGFVALLTNRLFVRHAASAEELSRRLFEANRRLQEQAAELEARTRELQVRQTQLEEAAAELSTSNEVLRRYRAHLEESTDQLEMTNAELLRLNQLLEERTHDAESANRAKTGFLAAMSHELRTPLNAITGYIDLLDLGIYGPVTAEQSNSYERIRYNSRHLLTLITDILSFAKIEAGRTELTLSDVQLGQVLQEAESVMRPLFEAKDIRFCTVAADHDTHVRGDRDRIRQILLNLLGNAVKYTDAGGAVSISTETADEKVRILVRDTGWGIAPDMQEAIFDPFVQVSRGPGGGLAEGVGLGLSISRALALEMHGTLTVTSSLGAGSTFTLTLPRSRVGVAAIAG